MTQVDHHDHEALVAVDVSTGEGIGVARFVRVGDDVAEPAIVVAAYRPIVDDRSALEDALHGAEGRVHDRGVEVTSRLLAGDPALSILYAATRERAGLIVVESPSREGGGSEGCVLWSAVAHHAPCDVLIARRPGWVKPPDVAPERCQ